MSRRATSWFRQHRIDVLPWTPNSPDMSPIEDIWRIFKKGLKKKHPRTVDELKAAITELWSAIIPADCQDLASSMPNRVSALLKCKGGITHY